MINATINRLKVEEGFRSKPYQCSEGVWSIGYGFTYLTKQESELILGMRVQAIHMDMLGYRWYQNLNDTRRGVVIQLYYQLGKKGLFGFKKMIRNLENENWNMAALELRDSRFFRQTPDRALRLCDKLQVGR